LEFCPEAEIRGRVEFVKVCCRLFQLNLANPISVYSNNQADRTFKQPRSDAKYAIADRYEEATGEYLGLRLAQLVSVDLNSNAVLVRRKVADAQLARQVSQTAPLGTDDRDETTTQRPPTSEPMAGATRCTARPRRFYAKVALDPNRPTPQVSNIAQSILSELDRVRGTRVTLTLDIDAEAAHGFPEDVESVVRDNASSLRITYFGFED
jgi:hypothetical protein